MMLLLVLWAAALQQPRSAPAAPPAPGQSVASQPVPPAPVTPEDSTVAAILDIARKVGEVRSVYDLYRRASFNESNSVVLERGTRYGASCRALDSAAQQGRRSICRGCLPRHIQPAVDQYRAYLPTLQRLAASCANRMRQLTAPGDAGLQGAALRRDVGAAGARLVDGLSVYEARLHLVRVALGWAPPDPPGPRRGT
jgi:hypothetical protein